MFKILFRMIRVQNQITKEIVYCSLKNMSLHGNGARGDTKCQNFDIFLKKGKYVEKEKFLVNSSDLMSKSISSELKAFFSNPFLERLISILSIYFHDLGGCIRQIKLQI